MSRIIPVSKQLLDGIWSDTDSGAPKLVLLPDGSGVYTDSYAADITWSLRGIKLKVIEASSGSTLLNGDTVYEANMTIFGGSPDVFKVGTAMFYRLVPQATPEQMVDYAERVRKMCSETQGVKQVKCMGCGKSCEVEADYEPQFCCSGADCGCRGLPINPIFCDDCEKKLFGGAI